MNRRNHTIHLRTACHVRCELMPTHGSWEIDDLFLEELRVFTTVGARPDPLMKWPTASTLIRGKYGYFYIPLQVRAEFSTRVLFSVQNGTQGFDVNTAIITAMNRVGFPGYNVWWSTRCPRERLDSCRLRGSGRVILNMDSHVSRVHHPFDLRTMVIRNSEFSRNNSGMFFKLWTICRFDTSLLPHKRIISVVVEFLWCVYLAVLVCAGYIRVLFSYK